MDQHYHKQYGNSNNLTGGGVDYNSGPYNVTFPGGVTSVSFNITINNDGDKSEDNETFNLIIDKSMLPKRVTVGTTSQVIVTIVNDDCECIIYNQVLFKLMVLCAVPISSYTIRTKSLLHAFLIQLWILEVMGPLETTEILLPQGHVANEIPIMSIIHCNIIIDFPN